MEAFSNISWMAVLVGAVLSFLAGWLWFSPALFGKKWAEGSRVELGSADEMPIFAMIAQFIALLLISTMVGLAIASGETIIAIIAILGIAVFSMSNGAFVKKTNYAIMVDGSYAVVAGLIMIIVQSIL